MIPSDKITATFVDREEELKTLKSLFKDASQGRGVVAFIYGEAGIGKTRLLAEFENFVVSEGANFLKGRGVYGEESSPYLPFIEAMNRYFEKREEAEVETSAPGLIGMVSERMDVPVGLVVLDEKSDKLDLRTERDRMFGTIANLIKDISEEKPLVLSLDDLQWADTGTLRLLHYLARNIQDEKVMVLGAYRPEDLKLRDERDGLTEFFQRMGQEDLFVPIKIERLTPESIEQMIKELLNLEELPKGFVNKLHEESEGNPYFVEEVVKSLVREGVLEAFTKGEVDLLLEEMTIPSTIKDIVWRRIGRLDDDAKKVVMMASVIGTRFQFDVLLKACGMEEMKVLDALDRLIENGLVHEDSKEKEEVYKFDHGQVRAVIYDSLSKSRRRVLHNKIGEVMEDHYRGKLDDVVYSLARHYYIGKNFTKALKYLLISAKEATKQYAIEEALSYYRSSLEALRHLESTPTNRALMLNLTLKFGKLLFTQGRLDEALTQYQHALKLSEQTGDNLNVALAYREMGHTYKYRGDYDKAEEYFEKALEISAKEEMYFDIADIHRGLGYLQWRRGEFEDAIQHYNLSIANIDHIGDENLLGVTLIELGNVYNTRGDRDKAIAYYTKSIELLEKLGDYVELPRALNNRGDLYLQREEWDKARIDLEKAIQASEKSGNRWAKAWALFNVAEGYIQSGDFEKAEKVLEKSFKLCHAINEKLALHGVYKNYGLLYRTKKDWDRAIEHYEKALSLLREIKVPYETGRRTYELALVYIDMGDNDKAKELLNESIGIFEEVSAKKELEKAKKVLMGLEPVQT